jgi:tetraacyldisaccharide 4'-kinase
MGGRGKTPLVAHVARLLVAAGERPAILSRGYARADRADGVVVVSDGDHLQADVARAGDEPFMLARQLPGVSVLVSEDRALAGRLAERAFGVTVHLIDDGFQHLSLARDADIVIAAPDDLDGKPMPFGRLREPVSALASADAIVATDDPSDLVRRYMHAAGRPTVFTLTREIGDPVPVEGGEPITSRGPAVPFSGIASPQRFLASLEEDGWLIQASFKFADHHRYQARDLDAIARVAQGEPGSQVLTTEKDAVRLLALRPLPVPVAWVPLTVRVDPAADFQTWLIDRVRHRKTA